MKILVIAGKKLNIILHFFQIILVLNFPGRALLPDRDDGRSNQYEQAEVGGEQGCAASHNGRHGGFSGLDAELLCSDGDALGCCFINNSSFDGVHTVINKLLFLSTVSIKSQLKDNGKLPYLWGFGITEGEQTKEDDQ